MFVFSWMIRGKKCWHGDSKRPRSALANVCPWYSVEWVKNADIVERPFPPGHIHGPLVPPCAGRGVRLTIGCVSAADLWGFSRRVSRCRTCGRRLTLIRRQSQRLGHKCNFIQLWFIRTGSYMWHVETCFLNWSNLLLVITTSIAAVLLLQLRDCDVHTR